MGLGGVTKHCSLEGAMLHHPNGDTKSSPLIFIFGGELIALVSIVKNLVVLKKTKVLS